MRIHGIDFTSRPTRRKPITCQTCTLDDRHLTTDTLQAWPTFYEFEHSLRQPGPWIAGLDFPFGQARRFIENIGWPENWAAYVDHVASMSRPTFRDELDAYRAPRPAGDKEHRRKTDIVMGAISAQKLYRTPVGLMFFEGAPRLRQAGVTIPHLQQGDPDRIVVEAYPGVLARYLIGRRSYKNDDRQRQSADQRQARADMIQLIKDGALIDRYGLTVDVDPVVAEDPSGDQLDALFCAIQAAWAWIQRHNDYGAPPGTDLLEGWIANPGG